MKRPSPARLAGSLALLLALGALGVLGCGPRPLAGEATGPTVTSVFRVEGMTCGGCEAGVELSVGRLAGVGSVDASYEEARATVSYDPEQLGPEQIVAAIEKLGYSAELTGPPPEADASPRQRS